MADEIYESLLLPANMCTLTFGVEEQIECSEVLTDISLICYESKMTKTKQRRYLLMKDSVAVSGMIVEKIDGLWYVCHLYTDEEYRRQGAGRLLFNAVNGKLKGKLRHSELLSPDGQKFVNS